MTDIIERIRNAIILRRPPEEDIHDFLGVVEIDLNPRMGVLVLPDHVAAVLKVSGTDYAYTSSDERAAILDRWESTLNTARLSIQIFVDRRPYEWGAPGAFLDELERQVEDSNPSDWQRHRLKRWQDAILSGELERRFPVADLRHYMVVRYAMGRAESIRNPGEPPMYVPPNRSWRFWETVTTAFGDKRRGLDVWRNRRNEAIRGLHAEVTRLENDARNIPGFRLERLSGLELVQLLHLLWRGRDAYDEWIDSEERLEQIRRGDVPEEVLTSSSDQTVASRASEIEK